MAHTTTIQTTSDLLAREHQLIGSLRSSLTAEAQAHKVSSGYTEAVIAEEHRIQARLRVEISALLDEMFGR